MDSTRLEEVEPESYVLAKRVPPRITHAIEVTSKNERDGDNALGHVFTPVSAGRSSNDDCVPALSQQQCGDPQKPDVLRYVPATE